MFIYSYIQLIKYVIFIYIFRGLKYVIEILIIVINVVFQILCLCNYLQFILDKRKYFIKQFFVFFNDGVKRKVCDCVLEWCGRKLFNYLSCDSRWIKLFRKLEIWWFEKDLLGCFLIIFLMVNLFYNIFKFFIFLFLLYMLIENLCVV